MNTNETINEKTYSIDRSSLCYLRDMLATERNREKEFFTTHFGNPSWWFDNNFGARLLRKLNELLD